MKFIACEIDNQKKEEYAILLKAFEKSIKTNCPNDEVEIAILEPSAFPGTHHIKTSYVANSVKLSYWKDVVKKETQNLCLIDGDTVVLKDMNHVFDLNFDIAYTRRSIGEKLPINGGVLFVRPSAKVAKFMEDWSKANNKMLVDIPFHIQWYKIFNGINQASFGYMLNQKHGLKIIELPCDRYNACDPQNWISVGDHTHVLHVKSALRVACVRRIFVKEYAKAITLWNKYVTW